VPTLRFVLLLTAAAALAISLAGCARYYWSRPGSSVEQFEQDSRECALRTSANPTEASLGIVNDKAYRACLEARQWVRTKESVPPPPGSYRGFE
jgi:ABC-type uncharacterized transport system auxiliary subunit